MSSREAPNTAYRRVLKVLRKANRSLIIDAASSVAKSETMAPWVPGIGLEGHRRGRFRYARFP